MACCWWLDFVRAACNVATDVVPKVLDASISTLAVGYKYQNDAWGTHRYYINFGGTYADWFDITNSECSYVSCDGNLATSTGSAIWSSHGFGDVIAGAMYIDTNGHNPISSPTTY